MKKYFLIFVLVFSFGLTEVYADKDYEEIIKSEKSHAELVEKVKPALVNISAVHVFKVQANPYRFFFGDPFEEFFGYPNRRMEPEIRKYRQEGTGSGFIIDPEGYVLTNYHVIRNAEEIKVTTYDDKTYEAEIVGTDPRTDISVIKIKSKKKFDALKMGDSDKTRVGDWVIAAGSPFGLNQTFTSGIISAVRQDIQIENRDYRNMFQTDASINRGNSGGPLVDMNGNVIGINTAIYAPTGVFSGVGFAIPINQAKAILNELIDKGHVVRGWLGVEIKNVDTAIKKSFNLDSAEGVLVNRVVEDSPAEKGGLQRGDVIVKFNGSAIRNASELQEKVMSQEPGTKVSIAVIRDGKEQELKVELGELPDEVSYKKDEDKKEESVWKGVKVSNVSPALKEKYNLKEAEGVLVVEIDPAKEGYETGLRVGDVIQEINSIEVRNVDDFNKAVKKINLKEGVVFDVIRNGRPLYISYYKGD